MPAFDFVPIVLFPFPRMLCGDEHGNGYLRD